MRARLMTLPTERQQTRTIEDFGRQWQAFDDIDHGFYGQDVLFDDILLPFLNRDDVRGTRVADIGSGTGRIVRMLVAAGAAEVTAVEPSAAFAVLKNNTADIAERIRYLNVTGDRLPPEAFDYVFSIGVVHHIPDPLPTIRAAYEALKPGGRLVIWLYGREGNALYLAFALPLRAVTRRLPDSLLTALSWLLLPPLWLYIRLCRLLPLPMRGYMRDFLAKLSPRQLVATIFDQLNPAYARYYTRDEAHDLLENAGFRDVLLEHRHGYSWTVCGTR